MWGQTGRSRFSLAMRHRVFFISTAESALAGIAALVPVGSSPELSRKRTEPRGAGPPFPPLFLSYNETWLPHPSRPLRRVGGGAECTIIFSRRRCRRRSSDASRAACRGLCYQRHRGPPLQKTQGWGSHGVGVPSEGWASPQRAQGWGSLGLQAQKGGQTPITLPALRAISIGPAVVR